MKKYIVEFIGTFFLVLTVGMTVIDPGAGPMAPVAIGSALMIMIFAGGHISGGHFNPAVTLSVWLRGRCPTGDVGAYMLAQILGAGTASFIALYLKGDPMYAAKDVATMPALIAEFLGTFALTYVVLNVATAKGTSGNSFYGLAIGFTVMTMAYAFSAVSACAFNPAVAVGLAVMHITKVANLWIYLLGNFAAGAVSAITFKLLNPEDN
jgi:aquaporin Z